eukprot:UN25736
MKICCQNHYKMAEWLTRKKRSRIGIDEFSCWDNVGRNKWKTSPRERKRKVSVDGKKFKKKRRPSTPRRRKSRGFSLGGSPTKNKTSGLATTAKEDKENQATLSIKQRITSLKRDSVRNIEINKQKLKGDGKVTVKKRKNKKKLTSPKLIMDALIANEYPETVLRLSGTVTYQMNADKYTQTLSTILMTNTTLKQLHLENLSISTVSLIVLSEAMKNNKTAEVLNLSYNNSIENEGLVALANALAENTTLLELHLKGLNVKDKACNSF